MTDNHQSLFRKGIVLVVFFLCLGSIGIPFTRTIPKTTLASDQEDIKKISVVYSKDSIPFHYSNQDGEPEGLIIDYWRLW